MNVFASRYRPSIATSYAHRAISHASNLHLQRSNTTSSLPAIILAHGFWDGTAHWSKAILELKRLGHDNLHAVELPLTSLADDAERAHKMIAQQQGPVLLVGHFYGGAVIIKTGNQPNVIRLVYITTFAPDSSRSPSGITREHLPLAAANLASDSDGYL